MTGYTVTHIGRSTRQDGPEPKWKERAMIPNVGTAEEDASAALTRNLHLAAATLEGSGESLKAITICYAVDVIRGLAAERDALAARVKALETAAAEAPKWAWMSMSSAPTNSRHVILAIPTPGGFVRSVEGAFMDGQWMNALDIDVQPLCWAKKTPVPDEFLPWTEAYAALHPTLTGEAS